MIFYSAQTQGFYDSTVFDRARPDDAVEISAALHAELMRGQSAGLKIVVESNGMPRLQEPPENAAAVERGWRDSVLKIAAGVRDRHRDQLEMALKTTLSAEQFLALLACLQTLRDWPQSAAFPDPAARPVLPDFLLLEGEQ